MFPIFVSFIVLFHPFLSFSLNVFPILVSPLLLVLRIAFVQLELIGLLELLGNT